MPNDPVPAHPLNSSRAAQMVATVTEAVTAIAQLIASLPIGAALNLQQIEQLTALLGNLAGVAIQAAHEVVGKPITPDSVLALMPAATALVNPPENPASKS